MEDDYSDSFSSVSSYEVNDALKRAIFRVAEDKSVTWASVVSSLKSADGKDAADIFRMLGEISGVVHMSAREKHAWELFAVRCARHIQGDMVDARSVKALDVREYFILGLASKEEMAHAIEGARGAVKSLTDGDWKKESAARIAQDVAEGLPASSIVNQCRIHMEYTPGKYGGITAIPAIFLEDFKNTCGVERKRGKNFRFSNPKNPWRDFMETTSGQTQLQKMDAAWFTLLGKLGSGQATPQELSDAVAAVEVERLRVGLPPIETLADNPWAVSPGVFQ